MQKTRSSKTVIAGDDSARLHFNVEPAMGSTPPSAGVTPAPGARKRCGTSVPVRKGWGKWWCHLFGCHSRAEVAVAKNPGSPLFPESRSKDAPAFRVFECQTSLGLWLDFC